MPRRHEFTVYVNGRIEHIEQVGEDCWKHRNKTICGPENLTKHLEKETGLPVTKAYRELSRIAKPRFQNGDEDYPVGLEASTRKWGGLAVELRIKNSKEAQLLLVAKKAAMIAVNAQLQLLYTLREEHGVQTRVQVIGDAITMTAEGRQVLIILDALAETLARMKNIKQINEFVKTIAQPSSTTEVRVENGCLVAGDVKACAQPGIIRYSLVSYAIYSGADFENTDTAVRAYEFTLLPYRHRVQSMKMGFDYIDAAVKKLLVTLNPDVVIDILGILENSNSLQRFKFITRYFSTVYTAVKEAGEPIYVERFLTNLFKAIPSLVGGDLPENVRVVDVDSPFGLKKFLVNGVVVEAVTADEALGKALGMKLRRGVVVGLRVSG